jgi:hypothetical protein
MIHTILWRRLDAPGHDSARLFFHDSQSHLTGTAVFVEAQQPCRLDYRVICDESWQTLSGAVIGWLGSRAINVELRADTAHRWQLNEADCPAVTGCIDLDLAFTPSTNMLPIRRLKLPVGQAAEVRAAWLSFPELALEPLDQVYRRKDAAVYAYESDGGRFSTELQVNATGFVTLYPALWQAETAT